MKMDQDGYELHFFVCTNEKSKGRGCGPMGAEDLLEDLKSWAKETGLKGRIRINKAGCMGRCESGIVCAAYPKGEWIIEAKPEDLPKIKKWIENQLNPE